MTITSDNTIPDRFVPPPLLMEAYPFQKRLAEIMVTAIETCPPETTAREVAQLMAERGVGSILVVDDQRRLCGLITEHEMVTRALAPAQSDPDTLTAGEIMQRDPPTMFPDTYMYEAMSEMTRHHLKYLPIVADGEVVGMVSLHDLMRYRSHKAMLLLGSIREEQTLAGLAAIRRKLVTVAQTLLAEMRSAEEMTEILSYIHHGIIRRTFELCLAEAAAAGQPVPKVRYCLLLLGSAGRREMLLDPDQDHALLFEDYPADHQQEVEGFFAPLGARLVAALAEVGYPRCEGGVMADSPQWRGRLTDWRERLYDWVCNPEPQQVRTSSIFFDFTAIYGEAALAQQLRELVQEQVTGQPGFLYQMMALDLRYKVPVGLLGRFLVERGGEHPGELSLKFGGILYIVDCVRMFALEKGVGEVNTYRRLKALVAADIFATETAEHIRAAFEALTFLRLRQEIHQIEAGQPVSHHLDPHRLSKSEQELLREAFQAVSKLQDSAKRYFSRNPF